VNQDPKAKGKARPKALVELGTQQQKKANQNKSIRVCLQDKKRVRAQYNQKKKEKW
jgi:hypothetical protein